MAVHSFRAANTVSLQETGMLFLLFIAGSVFALRGPFRAMRDTGINDLLSPYVQSAAWVHGVDPYSPRSLLEFWPTGAENARPAAQEMQDGSVLVLHGIPTAYPVTCFLLLGPFTLIPWPVFKLLWIFGSVGLLLGTIYSLSSLAGLNVRQRTWLALGTLLLAPFHTGIATCNPAIISTEIGVISAWAAHEQKNVMSGILAAVCVALKPQIGLCFLAYYVLRRLWKVSLIGLGALFAITITAVLRLTFAHAQWLANYEFDNHALLVSGVLGDFTERNPTRFGLVNFQVALYPLIGSRDGANIAVLVLCAVLLGIAFVLIANSRAGNDLLALSTISTLSLLAIYHRFYDAALLVLPLCWFLKRSLKPADPRLRPSFDKTSAAGLLAIAGFAVPGGSLLEKLRDSGYIPAVLSRNAWWNTFVMAHAAWCLVAISLVLLYQLAVRKKEKTDVSRPENLKWAS